MYLFTDLERLTSLKSKENVEETFKEPSVKEQHIMEEFEKLLNHKRNQYEHKIGGVNKLSKVMLKISFTISRILFQFGNDTQKEFDETAGLSESLKFIGSKLEKCMTFLQSEKLTNMEDKMKMVDQDLNDSMIIDKGDIEPPAWLRLQITKYKSRETLEV